MKKRKVCASALYNSIAGWVWVLTKSFAVEFNHPAKILSGLRGFNLEVFLIFSAIEDRSCKGESLTRMAR